MGLDNPLHIAILVVVLLLVFGAKRVPELGRALGTSMREFREGITGSAPPPPPAVESAHPPDAAPTASDAVASAGEPASTSTSP
jgi:sec-independent protein translocase protein TatA